MITGSIVVFFYLALTQLSFKLPYTFLSNHLLIKTDVITTIILIIILFSLWNNQYELQICISL